MSKDKEETMITDRQKEVLQLVWDGLPYKQIADKLGISKRTIDKHMQLINRNLETNCAILAIRKARKLKYIEP